MKRSNAIRFGTKLEIFLTTRFSSIAEEIDIDSDKILYM